MTYLTEDLVFTVPLTSENFIQARQYARRYKNERKSQQIYQNRLAVRAVSIYCQSMGIAIEPNQSDRLDLITQILMNVADLTLLNLGKLECIPVQAGDTFCQIPPETWENRIGYLIVEIDESAREATLRKFLPPQPFNQMKKEFSLDELEPLDCFLEHIANLEEAIAFLQSQDTIAIQVQQKLEDISIPKIASQLELIYRTYPVEQKYQAIAHLLSSQIEVFNLLELADKLLSKLNSIWTLEQSTTKPAIDLSELMQDITQVVHYGWQTLENLLESPEYNKEWYLVGSTRFKNSNLANLKIAKPIIIGERDKHPIALLVEVKQKSNQIKDCKIIVSSLKESSYLPPNLKLNILDELGNICSQRQIDNNEFWFDLSIEGELRDRFTLKVELDDASFEENFII